MLKINSKTFAVKFELLYLITTFLLSFVNGFITEFAYMFVFGGFFLALFSAKCIRVPRNFQLFTGLVILGALLQYLILGNFSWKWMLNFCGFMVGIVSVATIVSKMSRDAMFKLDLYLRRLIFILGTTYALSPAIEYGFTSTFFTDGNYLYASASRFLADGLVEKQMMSAFLLLYVIVGYGFIKKSSLAIPTIIPLIFAINMLIASRSQVIGFVAALILITITRGKRLIKISSIVTSALFFLLVYLMSLDLFTQFHQMDIRVMLFHAAAVTFFSNLFYGVGLYTLPQFLEVNNQAYFSNFAWLYPVNWGTLASFPTGFESSFFQFAVELGIIWFFILYLAIKFLIKNYQNIDSKFRYLAFFGISYFFSAITEDNLTQPPVYILASLFIGLHIRSDLSLRDSTLMPAGAKGPSRG